MTPPGENPSTAGSTTGSSDANDPPADPIASVGSVDSVDPTAPNAGRFGPPADPIASVDPADSVGSVDPTAPNSGRFGPLPPEVRRRWSKFCAWEVEYFPNHVGMVVEDLRQDYARLRLPWQNYLRQPEGVMHGGVIAALVDTCVVPAVATHYPTDPRMATVHLGVQFLRAVRGSDIVAEAWVEHRGRSMVYCRAEVRSEAPDGSVELVATASLVFRVSPQSSQSSQSSPDSTAAPVSMPSGPAAAT